MPHSYTCAEGHHWDKADGHAGTLACPVCGAPPGGPAGLPSTDELDSVMPDSGPVHVARRPATEINRPAATSVPYHLLPAVPGYEMLGELGRGGMGVVYKARQKGLNRIVALKMILAGAHAGPQDLLRFKTEAEAVARLQHPNIVQIYEIGEHEGRPFFSLEFVDGGSLARKLAGHPQPPPFAARMIESLARAMHYAHHQGIIHRDLKPANVLLKEHDGKITDFGLAKKLEGGSELTQSGTILGTPSYMAPEQAAGRATQIGPGADVYALGAMLYEMLTGRPPFRGETPFDTVLMVLSQEPVPPIRLQPKIPIDLDTICLKCLQKDPTRRYASAEALADDLRRFLHHEPILARPVGAWERGVKWARRRPAIAGLILLTVLVAMLGFAGVTWQWRQAEAARGRAEGLAQAEANQRLQTDAALADVQGRLYFHRIALANREWAGNHVGRAETLLDECPPGLRRWEWDYLKRRCHADRLTLRGSVFQAQCVVYSPDGLALASGWGDGHVRFWNPVTGDLERDWHLHLLPVDALAIAPDSQRAASAGGEGTVKIWNIETGRVIRSLPANDLHVRRLAFSPDGQRLATLATKNDQSEIRLWNAASGEQVLQFRGHKGHVNSMAFSPDGQQMASVGVDQAIRVWDTSTGKEAFALKDAGVIHSAATWNPEGRRLATGTDDGSIKLWDLPGRKEERLLRGHTDRVRSLAFSADGLRLVSGGNDETVRIWSGAPTPLTLRGHKAAVTGVAFAPDGLRVASSSHDATVKVWDARATQSYRFLRSQSRTILQIAFDPTTARLASVGNDGSIRIWDAEAGATIQHWAHPGQARCLAYRPDGKRLATGGKDKIVRIWDPDSGQEIQALTGHSGFVGSVAFSADGKRIASAVDAEVFDEARVWDADTGQVVCALTGHKGTVAALAFSPDGKLLATGCSDNLVRLWDAASGQLLRTFTGHSTSVGSLAFSPDGIWLASGSKDEANEIKIWEASSGQERITIRGHARGVTALAFTRDGQRLVSASYDKTVKVWEPRTGQEVLQLPRGIEPCWSLAFSPDGQVLATGGGDDAIRLYEARPRHP